MLSIFSQVLLLDQRGVWRVPAISCVSHPCDISQYRPANLLSDLTFSFYALLYATGKDGFVTLKNGWQGSDQVIIARLWVMAATPCSCVIVYPSLILRLI